MFNINRFVLQECGEVGFSECLTVKFFWWLSTVDDRFIFFTNHTNSLIVSNTESK